MLRTRNSTDSNKLLIFQFQLSDYIRITIVQSYTGKYLSVDIIKNTRNTLQTSLNFTLSHSVQLSCAILWGCMMVVCWVCSKSIMLTQQQQPSRAILFLIEGGSIHPPTYPPPIPEFCHIVLILIVWQKVFILSAYQERRMTSFFIIYPPPSAIKNDVIMYSQRRLDIACSHT